MQCVASKKVLQSASVVKSNNLLIIKWTGGKTEQKKNMNETEEEEGTQPRGHVESILFMISEWTIWSSYHDG